MGSAVERAAGSTAGSAMESEVGSTVESAVESAVGSAVWKRHGLRGSPGSRGCSVKCCSGSRPSTWQNCWTWLAVFSGWISTTSPAEKLWGRDTQGLGRGPPAGGGRWGLWETAEEGGGGPGGPAAPGRVGPASPAVISALSPTCTRIGRGAAPPWTVAPSCSPDSTGPWGRPAPDPRVRDVELNQPHILEVRGPRDPLIADHGCQERL